MLRSSSWALPQPRLDMVLLLPELTFLTGISEIKKDTRVLKVGTAPQGRAWRCGAAPRGLAVPHAGSLCPTRLALPRRT